MKLLAGDCVERMRELDEASVEAVVTDPPYGIGFMGHEWDQPGAHRAVKANGRPRPFASGSDRRELQRAMERAQRRGSHHAGTGFDSRPSDNGAFEAGRYDFSPTANHRFQAWTEAWAAEALRVLKPGGHLVSFGGTRTYHRLVAGVEDAGFEIRDCLAWLFGSGFPKSRDVGGGRGTALKPAFEPIVLARKPLAGTVAANVEQHGTGALNIDACRISIDDHDAYERNHSGDRGHAGTRPLDKRGATDLRPGGGSAAAARWPANVVLAEEAGRQLDEQSRELARRVDRGGASRFFYCAKVSRAERNAGLTGFDEQPMLWSSGTANPGTFQSDGTHRAAANHHPTVKPLALMRWLIRLVTPAGGVVLDPFMGSGTTGAAAALEGYDFVGIEREPDYLRIAEARIAYWAARPVEEVPAA